MSKRAAVNLESPAAAKRLDARASPEKAQPPPAISKTSPETPLPQGLYLDGIQRTKVDFDVKRVCSVTLATRNIYACLVCGRYLQGRGPTTPAFRHALEEDHHVFVSIPERWSTEPRVFVLPEGKRVAHAALGDISQNVLPRFSAERIAALDRDALEGEDLAHEPYTVGFLGLNNGTRCADYANVVVQMLAHVPPVRDALLQLDATEPGVFGPPAPSCALLASLALLVRKLWSDRAWKRHVSPQQLLDQLAIDSDGAFCAERRAEPAALLEWLFSHLAKQLVRSRYSKLLTSTFAGRFSNQSVYQVLPLALKAVPLFHDTQKVHPVPQTELLNLLAQHRGRIASLPPFLIVHIVRFAQTAFALEYNPTVVTFPLDSLDIGSAVFGPDRPAVYDLISSVSYEPQRHDSDSAPSVGVGSIRGSYKVHLRCRPSSAWYLIRDLTVESVVPATILLGEACLQVWALRS